MKEDNQSKQNHDVIMKILQQTNNIFRYGELIHLFMLMNRKNPYQQILSFQFQEEYKNNCVIILKIQDIKSGQFKSLKIYQQDELNINMLAYRDLIYLYQGYKPLLRDDLILKIYDLYYLEDNQIIFYFVIEMEFIDYSYDQFKEKLTSSSRQKASQIMKQAQRYLKETMQIKKRRGYEAGPYQYYVQIYGKNQFRIKLNILQDTHFYYYNQSIKQTLKEMCSSQLNEIDEDIDLHSQEMIDENDQKQTQPSFQGYFDSQKGKISFFREEFGESEDYKQMESFLINSNEDLNYDFYERDFEKYLESLNIFEYECKFQLIEIMYNNEIPKNSFVNFILNKGQQLIKYHPFEVFQTISKHPKYQTFSLIESDQQYFILKTSISKTEFYLKVQKFKNLSQVDRAFKLYEQYYLKENDIFFPINSYEILCGEDYFYILIEEKLNFFSSQEKQDNISFKKLLFSETTQIPEQTNLNSYLHAQLSFSIVIQILKLYQQKLYLSKFDQWDSVFYNVTYFPNKIFIQNPLFLANIDLVDENTQRKIFLRSFNNLIYNLSNFHSKLNISLSINKMTQKILQNFYKKINNKNLEENQSYLGQELENFEQYLGKINIYLNITLNLQNEKEIIMLEINTKWKIQATLVNHEQILQIDRLNQLQIDHLIIKNVNIPETINCKTLTQSMFLESLEINQEKNTDYQKGNIEAFFSLYPFVKAINLSIKNQSDLFFSALYQFKQLEQLQIFYFDYDNYDIKGFYALHDLFKENTRFKLIYLGVQFFDIQVQINQWKKSHGKSILLLKHSKGLQLLQYNSIQFQKEQLGVQYELLKYYLRQLFGTENQTYLNFNLLLSNLIDEYRIECTAQPSSIENSINLTFSNKLKEFEDLKVVIQYVQELKILNIYNRNISCLSCLYNYQGAPVSSDLLKYWWISENYTKQIRKVIGNIIEVSCHDCNKIQLQVSLYRNQQQLQKLFLHIDDVCKNTLYKILTNKNFFQFSNLPNLFKLCLDLSNINLQQIDFGYYLSPHLNQLKSLSALRIISNVDKNQFKKLKTYLILQKIKHLVSIKIY